MLIFLTKDTRCPTSFLINTDNISSVITRGAAGSTVNLKDGYFEVKESLLQIQQKEYDAWVEFNKMRQDATN